MNKKKKIILLSTIAGGIIVLGVVIALVLSPLTKFLYGGTGDEFHQAGSCGGNAIEPEAEGTANVFITPPQNADVTPAPSAAGDATPAPTIDPYEALYEKADTSMMKDIVNILLVGVDYSTERETWSGKKEWHSDVMMVLAVNFEENRADLISLPRDTYANIPDVKGIYKLNASLNCGGGLYNSDGSFNPAGLEKVCDAAEWMLGGIPVDYYYAVTMTSLKDLVDLCGGVDYDMDVKFKIQGRSYEKGMQHLNGQGFLDYCRVRKGTNGLPASEQGDANRVNRQKRILIALFKQMQADKLITKIPDIIETFDGDLFTNCTGGQTAALAAFAYNLDASNIGMYSMSGNSASMFQWNFVFTDQANRVDIIKKVYGVNAKRYSQYTYNYARYRWCDMLYEKYIELIDPLTHYVQALIDEDDLLPEFTSSPIPTDQPTATPRPTDKPTATPKPTDKPTATPKPTDQPTETPKPTEKPPEPTIEPPSAPSTDAPIETPAEGNAIGAVKLSAHGGALYGTVTPEPTRKYSRAQRELFETYKIYVKELKELHTEADKEANKARNGSGNSLSSVGQAYLKKLAETQAIAIEVARTFSYSKVKNFMQPFSPTSSGWSSSPWAVNYGRNKKFNEVIVDFN